jgi:hypothetical protein
VIEEREVAMRTDLDWAELLRDLAADARVEGRAELAHRIESILTPDGGLEETDWLWAIQKMADRAKLEDHPIAGRLRHLARIYERGDF